MILAGFHGPIEDHILVGHHSDLGSLRDFDFQLELVRRRRTRRGGRGGIACRRSRRSGIWCIHRRRAGGGRRLQDGGQRHAARGRRGRGSRRHRARFAGGAPRQQAPRAEPAACDERKNYSDGSEPGEPWPVRRDHGRTAGPHRNAGAVADREGIFRDGVLFVEPEETGHGAHEPAVEDAAGKLVPLLAFDGFQEARGNACGGGNFLESDTAQLPLAFEALAKSAGGHLF